MKITISRDKKLLWALVLLTILNPIVYVVSYLSLEVLDRIKASFLSLNILSALVNFVFHIFLIYIVYQKISLKDNVVRVGLTSMQTFYCNAIKNIHFGEKIELTFKNVRKKFKIRVIDIDKNEDKYRQLIGHIKERVKIKIDVDRAINSLKANKKFANDESLAIGGWLIALLIWLIWAIMSHGILVTVFLLKLPFKVHDVATHFILLPFAIIILIMMLVKTKRFTRYLKGYFILEFAVISISTVVTKITQNQLDNTLSYILLVLSPISSLLLTIVKCRFIDISERIKHTFINE